ncbi:hypothetical protein Tco_1120922 [Tanacetum coccineum]|uniref:Uncharacterized protein n=1 Tax=Tanacetum coccineum TaxID=301880 RepID=A0ABQ5IW84_9ASTR
MFKDLEYVQSLEKEVDELESGKAEFSNEYDLLIQECVSKDIMCVILRSFDNLYEYPEMACNYLEAIAKCECLQNELSKLNENVKNKSFNEMTRKFEAPEFPEFFEINKLKAQIQDKSSVINELKKLIEKLKGKYVDTKFGKPSVVRQANAF